LCYAPRAIDGKCCYVWFYTYELYKLLRRSAPQAGFICIGKSWIPVLLLVFRFGNECLIAPVSILKILTKNFP
jgi:hypothetical protein